MNQLDKQLYKDLELLSDLATLMVKCKADPKLTYDEIKDELFELYKNNPGSDVVPEI